MVMTLCEADFYPWTEKTVQQTSSIDLMKQETSNK